MAIANWTFSKTGVDFLWGCQLLGSWIWGMGVSLDLGDGNQLGLVVQVVGAASQRYDFVLRLIASAYGTRPTYVGL
jgi:hypothetical protein